MPSSVWACLHEDTYFKKDARRLCGAQLHHRTYTLCTIPYPGAGGLHIAHSPLYLWFVFKCTSKFSLSIVYEMSQDLSIVLLEKFSKFNTAKKKPSLQVMLRWNWHMHKGPKDCNISQA